MRTKLELNKAFMATNYCVEYDGHVIVLNPTEPTPAELRPWLTSHVGAGSAWLVTAHNPGGELARAPRNRTRTWLLDMLLSRHGITCLPAVNKDPAGHWPDEPGWLIAGLEEGHLRCLAVRLGQAAVLAVGSNTVALLWCNAVK